jgi:hypothetical protein
VRTSIGGIVAVAFLGTAACRPTVDVAVATEALLQRDRAWAALADANGPVDSVVAFWTSDARVLLPGQPVPARSPDFTSRGPRIPPWFPPRATSGIPTAPTGSPSRTRPESLTR